MDKNSEALSPGITSRASVANSAELLVKCRDDSILALWWALRNLMEEANDTASDEDLDLWIMVTKHSSIQKRLDKQKGT